MYFQSQSATEDFQKANLFNEFFYSVYNKCSTETLDLRTNSPSPNHNILSEIIFSEEDIFNTLISLDPVKAIGVDGIGPKILRSCAEYLYKPLHYLFTMSIQQACMPKDWATHIIVPVYKSGEKNLIKNYRPISLLCNTSKVLERVIYDKIITFISNHITPYQFGTLKGRSTLQQLLIFLNYVMNSITQTDVIYLDISKAFDSIPHNQLLDKLNAIGIKGKLWRWFKCYLANRIQKVRINNSLSTQLPVISGVPQGSILGPLLFIIYMNDLPECLSVAESLMFVDDTKCYMNINSLPDNFILQNELNLIVSWSKRMCLNFNPTKSTFLCFKSIVETSYNISSTEIAAQSHHKDLGVFFTHDLSWDYHHRHVLSKAYSALGLLRRTFSKLHSPEIKKKLYLSIVRSQLMYCSTIWRPHLIKDIMLIEQLQRRATKFILNDYESDYFTRLTKLNLLPIMYHFELSDLMFAIKSLKSPTNNFDISKFISFCSGSTRSAVTGKLQHTMKSNNKLRHFYFSRLPRLWNALPPIDLALPISRHKQNIYRFMWSHFTSNFNPDNPCSFHLVCPCSKCADTPHPPNLS